MAKLVCRIELNKESGITVKVVNDAGKITQTMVLDGTAITTTCQGEQDTSTITQKSDSIAIKCKTFTLDAETITCKSSKDSLHESQQKFDIKSTQDTTVTSSAKITETATGDFAMSGNNITASATQKAKISGMNCEIAATQEAKMSGLQLKLAGTTQSELTGLTVKVEGTTSVKVASPLAASLEGSITNVKGTMVKIGP
jgi:hypothetical protein